MLRELFPDEKVLREASPDWLGRLRLDFYLPGLRLAIEHQGELHYQPIKVFVGEAAHQRGVERVALKRKLCAENRVEVVDIRFDTPISAAALAQRFKRFLPADLSP